MFLTRGPMPFEDIWRDFFGAVPSGTAAAAAATAATAGEPWRALFSLYTHPPPGFSYNGSSLFAGSEVAGRVVVRWGATTEVGAQGRAELLSLAAVAIPSYLPMCSLAEGQGSRGARRVEA